MKWGAKSVQSIGHTLEGGKWGMGVNLIKAYTYQKRIKDLK